MSEVYKVKSVEVKKTGTRKGKNGGTIPWTLHVLELEGTDMKPGGFDKVEPGDMVTVTEKQNGDYINYNYEKVKEDGGANSSSSSAPAAGGGKSDPRVLKLLVVMAEQMGVDKNQILDIIAGSE